MNDWYSVRTRSTLLHKLMLHTGALKTPASHGNMWLHCQKSDYALQINSTFAIWFIMTHSTNSWIIYAVSVTIERIAMFDIWFDFQMPFTKISLNDNHGIVAGTKGARNRLWQSANISKCNVRNVFLPGVGLLPFFVLIFVPKKTILMGSYIKPYYSYPDDHGNSKYYFKSGARTGGNITCLASYHLIYNVNKVGYRN